MGVTKQLRGPLATTVLE